MPLLEERLCQTFEKKPEIFFNRYKTFKSIVNNHLGAAKEVNSTVKERDIVKISLLLQILIYSKQHLKSFEDFKNSTMAGTSLKTEFSYRGIYVITKKIEKRLWFPKNKTLIKCNTTL